MIREKGFKRKHIFKFKLSKWTNNGITSNSHMSFNQKYSQVSLKNIKGLLFSNPNKSMKRINYLRERIRISIQYSKYTSDLRLSHTINK